MAGILQHGLGFANAWRVPEENLQPPTLARGLTASLSISIIVMTVRFFEHGISMRFPAEKQRHNSGSLGSSVGTGEVASPLHQYPHQFPKSHNSSDRTVTLFMIPENLINLFTSWIKKVLRMDYLLEQRARKTLLRQLLFFKHILTLFI
jgi:hypothetical protein